MRWCVELILLMKISIQVVLQHHGRNVKRECLQPLFPKRFLYKPVVFEQSVRAVGSVNSLGLSIPMNGTSGKKGFANYTGEIRAVTVT